MSLDLELFKDSYFSIAQGEVPGHSVVNKFGHNPDIDSGDTETVWSAGGTYPWSTLSTAATLSCVSTSASDTASLVIEGLDSDYNVQTETITLTGTTAVTTTKTFLRVYRMVYDHTANNAGTITAKISNTTVAQIDAGRNQTLMAVYTVPAGYTAYMVNLSASVDLAEDIRMELLQRPHGKNFRIAHIAELYQSTYRYDFVVALPFTEKTDIDMQAVASTNNCVVSANFDIILVKN